VAEPVIGEEQRRQREHADDDYLAVERAKTTSPMAAMIQSNRHIRKPNQTG
jgi:hypothetical protein